MTDDLLDLPDGAHSVVVVDEPAAVRVVSTPETKERYAFLKAKNLGEVWREGEHIYRKGPSGTTIPPPDPAPPPLEHPKTTSARSLQTQLPDDPRIQALARWKSASKKKPWSKPAILSTSLGTLPNFL
jgi:hypothetical protein